MILLRFREFGSSDWTELSVEGEAEEFAAEAIAAILADSEHLHVQMREGHEPWEDVEREDES